MDNGQCNGQCVHMSVGCMKEKAFHFCRNGIDWTAAAWMAWLMID